MPDVLGSSLAVMSGYRFVRQRATVKVDAPLGEVLPLLATSS